MNTPELDLRRARRATKSVNYAKEQEFSDDDVFEDVGQQVVQTPSQTPGASARKRKPSKRKSAAAATALTDETDAFDDMADGDAYEPLKTRYTEKGYDPMLLPIRDRFTFTPEFEPDGSPKIDTIVGRRPIVEDKDTAPKSKKKAKEEDSDEVASSSDDESDASSDDGKKKRKTKRGKKKKAKTKKNEAVVTEKHVEYEYLVKFKGRSYLHLEWKTGYDLESMNKSAKTMYRRFLKKLAAGTEEDLEDPTVDASFTEPQKILDEDEQEVLVEVSDKELVQWEKERERELAEEAAEDEDEVSIEGLNADGKETDVKMEEAKEEETPVDKEAAAEEEVEELEDPGVVSMDKLRGIIAKDGPYYAVFEGSDNAYRDGYITTPPRKARPSYLFFQACYRATYLKRFPGSVQSEIMSRMGDKWRTMTEEEQAPFIQLAKEESEQFEKEREMMEKAQKPNEMWQPIRRCRMLLDHLVADGFSNIFLEPVDMAQFPDYDEYVDQPMDLGTIRTKLANRKYQAPENFARDVRKIWNNCKVYNRHGSAIWYVADYMSKQFERLFQAWVLQFRSRYLRWINPKARPWEHSCRACDGDCGTAEDKMVLCDHCDAMYGMACLKPPLSKLPISWHCPDCKGRMGSDKTIRMLSAVSEQAARKRAELGDTPKKMVKRKMFLVKWVGLGYEHCSWETKDDLNDDTIIGEFRRLNNMTPDEPDLAEEEVVTALASVSHIRMDNAGGKFSIPDLRCQLYAQTRAFQFSKFGMEVPEAVCQECGPKTLASSAVPNDVDTDSKEAHPEVIVECVNDMVFRVARMEKQEQLTLPESMPPLLIGEYDAVVPITAKGLMMNVGEVNGSVAFLGYRLFPDGSKGPAEKAQLIRNVGDKIIAVDGDSTVNKTFKEVIMMLRESGKNKFAYMRFLESKYAVCNSELTSMGKTGIYTIEKLSKKFEEERGRLLVKRKKDLFDEDEAKKISDDDESDESVGSQGKDDSDSDDSDMDASEADFEPDSDDEELIIRQKVREQLAVKQQVSAPGVLQGTVASTAKAAGVTGTVIPPSPIEGLKVDPVVSEQNGKGPDNESSGEEKKASEGTPVAENGGAQTGPVPDDTDVKSSQATDATGPISLAIAAEGGKSTPSEEVPKEEVIPEQSLVCKQETTKSLAYRLLDIDVGYSSDEGGDEDCAYFLDGVDSTFYRKKEIEEELQIKKDPDVKDTTASEKEETRAEKTESRLLPVKKNEFSSLGERGKLCAAITLTSDEPDLEDFINFPLPSAKELAAKKALEEAELRAKAEREAREIEAATAKIENIPGPGDVVAKSNTKVEQISPSTSEVIRIWASVKEASATLQIPLEDIRQILKGIYDEEAGDEAGGYRWRYADENAEVTAASSTERENSKGKKAFLEFRDKLYDHRHPHVYKNENKLRDYQIDGVNWLASCWYKRHSCILADEMGLGKTVQIVSYIEHLHRVENIQRPYLVVVPLSTVEHWRREFEGWTDMKCCVYHDRQRVWRDVMREYEWYYEDRPHTPDYLKFDVLVTTYDTLIGDFDIIGQVPWRVTVVDEAHRLRNVKGKLLECMKEISARGILHYGFQSRILMTGTPLQNNTQELWTLLNFIEPFKFPSLEEFEHNFGNMANREQVEALQRKISPYMLRRVKEDVAKDIPAKEETLIDVELTSIQKQYYRAIFEHNHSFLSMGSTRATAPKLMNIQMELRKCCNHPFLLDGIEARESEKQLKEFSESGAFEGKTHAEQQLMLNEQGYIQTSGKMVLLDKLLPKLRQEGHKVLVFSQMVKMLDLISEYCDFKGFRHERLDGRVRGNERQKAIDRFETEPDSFMFLLSTRAGGVGINLTAADICIIFDSDWNPQNDVQAQARCHRIGQTKDVMIYRLITSRTFEQEMFDRASKKLGLEQAVLGTFGSENDDDKPTNQEMEQLLKKGAYALLEDENDEIGKEFCSDDIESILAKRTRTRVVEGAKTASWLNKSGMNVTKSRFTGDSAAATAGVNVDDPLFWQKVMPDFVTPTIMLTQLNDLSSLLEKGAIATGPGRGRKKKPVEPTEVAPTDEGDATNTEAKEEQEEGEQPETSDDKGVEVAPKEIAPKKYANGFSTLTRGNQKKINKFMSDLKSMMDGIFEEEEDDALPASEKSTCQKLLLTISVKEKIFSTEHRHLARVLLKRLEGDRRRRCRTTGGDEPARFARVNVERNTPSAEIPEELLIQSKPKKRRRRRKGGKLIELDDEADEKPQRKSLAGKDKDVDDDGYLQHSDSEGEWSDVGEDIYQGGRKNVKISMKEAKRRRAWASDKDTAAAAGRPWPSFPRSVVTEVLGAMLTEAIKEDKEKGGLFSVPVPRDSFPEYYEQIKQPMDYATMKQKLANGEYRSAMAMQKDFFLVMSNCLQFNAADSDIVTEARRQALLRPKMLKNAAMSQNLFIAEDGTVLEVLPDEEKNGKEDGGETTPKKRRGRKPKDKSNKPEEKDASSSSVKRLVRCKKCEECLKEDCGKCVACQDKRKFGGEGKLRHSCEQRHCKNMTEVVSTPASTRKVKTRKKAKDKIAVGDNESVVSQDEETESVENSSVKKKKPRIRISLVPKKAIDEDAEADGEGKKKKKRKKAAISENVSGENLDRKKRTRTAPEKTEENGDEAPEEINDSGKGRIPRKQKKKKKKESVSEEVVSSTELDEGEIDETDVDVNGSESISQHASSDPNDDYLETSIISKEIKSLDGTFENARSFLTKRGAWKLPGIIENDRFTEIARSTLNKMVRHDTYSLFSEGVSEDDAPGYFDMISHPMDFSTMMKKVEDGDYGTDSEASSKLFEDLVLIADNCAKYNDAGGEVLDEAARLMGLMPEAFSSACVAAAGTRSRGRKRKT